MDIQASASGLTLDLAHELRWEKARGATDTTGTLYYSNGLHHEVALRLWKSTLRLEYRRPCLCWNHYLHVPYT